MLLEQNCSAYTPRINFSATPENDSESDWHELETSMTWGWWMLQIGTPLILAVGLPGNILTLLVMKTHRYRTKSYSHYFCALAVFDSLVLIGKAVRRIDSVLIESGFHGLFHMYGDAACKVHNFAEHVCYLVSSWLVVCLTAERCVVVFYPLSKDRVCRPRHAVTVTLCIFAAASYTQLFRLVVFQRDDDDAGQVHAGGCTASSRYQQLYIVLHIYLYQLLLQFLLPTIFILIGNMAVLFKVRVLRHQQFPMEAARYRSSTARTGSSLRTTAVLLAVSFTYLVTLLPLLTLSVTMHVALTTDLAAAMRMFTELGDIRLVFELLSEFNYAANFYIYVLTADQFRQQLIRHLSGCSACCCRQHRHRRRLVRYTSSGLRQVVYSDPAEYPSGSRRHSAASGMRMARMTNRDVRQTGSGRIATTSIVVEN